MESVATRDGTADDAARAGIEADDFEADDFEADDIEAEDIEAEDVEADDFEADDFEADRTVRVHDARPASSVFTEDFDDATERFDLDFGFIERVGSKSSPVSDWRAFDLRVLDLRRFDEPTLDSALDSMLASCGKSSSDARMGGAPISRPLEGVRGESVPRRQRANAKAIASRSSEPSVRRRRACSSEHRSE